MSQTLRPGNITQVINILSLANENVVTNISLGVARNYIPYLVNFHDLEIEQGQLPGQSELINGMWIFLHDAEETIEMVRHIFMRHIEEELEEDETII